MNRLTFALTATILTTVAGVTTFCISLQDIVVAIDAGLLHPCVLEAFVSVALLICSLVLHRLTIVSEKREEI